MQRQDHGEQPIWLGVTLAAMLGQIGVPGGGIQHGYGSSADVGLARRALSPPALPQGRNREPAFIPVARVADMLLHPGSVIPYNGADLTYPHIDLVYWVGGNPFHHHQDINRLRRAWTRPKTIITNEINWTTTARLADIVFACTTPLEREDFAGGSMDHWLTPMRRALEP